MAILKSLGMLAKLRHDGTELQVEFAQIAVSLELRAKLLVCQPLLEVFLTKRRRLHWVCVVLVKFIFLFVGL